jgi:hypothetical protein
MPGPEEADVGSELHSIADYDEGCVEDCQAGNETIAPVLAKRAVLL